MNQTEKDLFILLKNGLSDSDEPILSAFGDVAALSGAHLCAPFVYSGYKKLRKAIPEVFKNFIMLTFIRNQLNMEVQNEIISILSDNNIPCAVIKGITVALNYPEPLARTLGDVDILVGEKNYEKALKLFRNAAEIEENDHKFHYRFIHKGITVEIHKYVTEYTSEKYGDSISLFMDDALNHVVYKEIDGNKVPSLSNKYIAVTLLLHTQRHFFENLLPLRILCDWAMFVKSVDGEEWREQIYPAIKKLGLCKLSDNLTAVANKYLGINCCDKVESKVDDKDIEYMVEEFLKGAVKKSEGALSRSFGAIYSKNKETTKSRLVALIKSINQIARHNFKLARMSPLFLPWFWFYVPARYLVRCIFGKRERIEIKTISETVHRKKYLINKLNLQD